MIEEEILEENRSKESSAMAFEARENSAEAKH